MCYARKPVDSSVYFFLRVMQIQYKHLFFERSLPVACANQQFFTNQKHVISAVFKRNVLILLQSYIAVLRIFF